MAEWQSPETEKIKSNASAQLNTDYQPAQPTTLTSNPGLNPVLSWGRRPEWSTDHQWFDPFIKFTEGSLIQALFLNNHSIPNHLPWEALHGQSALNTSALDHRVSSLSREDIPQDSGMQTDQAPEPTTFDKGWRLCWAPLE